MLPRLLFPSSSFFSSLFSLGKLMQQKQQLPLPRAVTQLSVSEGIPRLTWSGRAKPTPYELKVLRTVRTKQRIAAVNNHFPSEHGIHGFPHLLRGALHRARVWWLYKMKGSFQLILKASLNTFSLKIAFCVAEGGTPLCLSF